MQTPAAIHHCAASLAEAVRERRTRIDETLATLMESLDMRKTTRNACLKQMTASADFMADVSRLLADPHVAMSSGTRARWTTRLKGAVREFEAARAMQRFVP